MCIISIIIISFVIKYIIEDTSSFQEYNDKPYDFLIKYGTEWANKRNSTNYIFPNDQYTIESIGQIKKITDVIINSQKPLRNTVFVEEIVSQWELNIINKWTNGWWSPNKRKEALQKLKTEMDTKYKNTFKKEYGGILAILYSTYLVTVDPLYMQIAFTDLCTLLQDTTFENIKTDILKNIGNTDKEITEIDLHYLHSRFYNTISNDIVFQTKITDVFDITTIISKLKEAQAHNITGGLNLYDKNKKMSGAMIILETWGVITNSINTKTYIYNI